ncbi:hypothetical protein [Paenibacillus sacheonensis]|nr:hypothetical protein [Paenibacillus sacheonensis]MBM7565335.1 hypothetical protein [Paenibacillus sacheonensis]
MAKNKNNKFNAQKSNYNAEFASENAANSANASTKAASQKAEK